MIKSKNETKEENVMPLTKLPKDPLILISFINTQLRDHYASFDVFCADYNANGEEIKETLLDYGYKYDAEKNQFL